MIGFSSHHKAREIHQKEEKGAKNNKRNVGIKCRETLKEFMLFMSRRESEEKRNQSEQQNGRENDFPFFLFLFCLDGKTFRFPFEFSHENELNTQ